MASHGNLPTSLLSSKSQHVEIAIASSCGCEDGRMCMCSAVCLCGIVCALTGLKTNDTAEPSRPEIRSCCISGPPDSSHGGLRSKCYGGLAMLPPAMEPSLVDRSTSISTNQQLADGPQKINEAAVRIDGNAPTSLPVEQQASLSSEIQCSLELDDCSHDPAAVLTTIESSELLDAREAEHSVWSWDDIFYHDFLGGPGSGKSPCYEAESLCEAEHSQKTSGPSDSDNQEKEGKRSIGKKDGFPSLRNADMVTSAKQNPEGAHLTNSEGVFEPVDYTSDAQAHDLSIPAPNLFSMFDGATALDNKVFREAEASSFDAKAGRRNSRNGLKGSLACSTCSKMYSNRGNLDRHAQSHRVEKPALRYHCRFCKAVRNGPRGMENINTHMKQAHSQELSRLQACSDRQESGQNVQNGLGSLGESKPGA